MTMGFAQIVYRYAMRKFEDTCYCGQRLELEHATVMWCPICDEENEAAGNIHRSGLYWKNRSRPDDVWRLHKKQFK